MSEPTVSPRFVREVVPGALHRELRESALLLLLALLVTAGIAGLAVLL